MKQIYEYAMLVPALLFLAGFIYIFTAAHFTKRRQLGQFRQAQLLKHLKKHPGHSFQEFLKSFNAYGCAHCSFLWKVSWHELEHAGLVVSGTDGRAYLTTAGKMEQARQPDPYALVSAYEITNLDERIFHGHR